jgi:hypothetical protein
MAGPINIVTGKAILLMTVKNLQVSKLPITPVKVGLIHKIISAIKVMELFKYIYDYINN